MFRRREPLHERLAREGGMTPPPVDPGPHWGEVGIHGVPRLREWDAVVAVEAPGLGGEEVRFVALPDGSLVVEEGREDDDPSPFADALEGALDAPYRAEARRRHGETWAVGARSIDVVEIPEEVAGDELTLTAHEGERELHVDGGRTFGSVPSLERWAAERFESYSLTAARLDGDLWEVRAAAL
ncbi:MAG: hypothetical protein ACRDN6_13025 [Gaiellaceae bacterium]